MYPPWGVIPFIVVGYTRNVCERAWNVWERTYERIPDASERNSPDKIYAYVVLTMWGAFL